MTIKENLASSKKILRAKIRATAQADKRVVVKGMGVKKNYGNSRRNRKKSKVAAPVVDDRFPQVGRQAGNLGTGVQAAGESETVSS